MMDFTFGEEERAIGELAGRLVDDHATPERLLALETSGSPPFDRDLWKAMADAGLLGVTVAEADGGLGLGLLALAQVLEQVGRKAAHVPALATLGYGVPPVARFGTDAQRSSVLGPVVAGRTVLTAALVEPAGDPLAPTTVARPDGDGWLLSGTKTCVPAGMIADVVLVPASTPSGAGLLLVEAGADGVTRRSQRTITFTAEAELELADVRVGADALVGPADGAALAWTVARASAASCAVMAGAVDEALRLTAAHAATRHQFGHPIAGFQAVRQRLADGFVDSRAIRWTAYEALWRLEAGLPAEKEVAVAKYVAAEGGRRVTRGAQHIHGGTGVDRAYPVHRYYTLAKQLELSLGGVSRQLVALGTLLADEPEPAGPGRGRY